MTTTKLPELPEAHYSRPGLFAPDGPLFTAEQLRAYGEACRATAQEVGDGVDYTNPRMTAAQSGLMPFVTMTTATRPAAGRDGWIAVGERLPRNYEPVLAYAGTREYFAHYQVHDGGTDGRKAGQWYDIDADGEWCLVGVTHWQPLPSAPE